MIQSQIASLALLPGLIAAAPANPIFAQAPAGKQKTGGKEKGNSQATLSGYLDQQEGRYILVDDQPVADLEIEGFPTEGFAKYLGHTVTIRGTANPGSTHPLFKVRSIETVKDICAPASLTEKK